MMSYITISLVLFNGIYDVLSACGLLLQVKTPHTYLFTDHQSRFLAYWVFTYGIIRIWSAPFFGSNAFFAYLCVVSYLVEALFFAMEMKLNPSTHMGRTGFVVAACVLLACLLMLQLHAA